MEVKAAKRHELRIMMTSKKLRHTASQWLILQQRVQRCPVALEAAPRKSPTETRLSLLCQRALAQQKDLLKPSDQPETPSKESVTSTVDGPIWGRRTAIVGSPGDVMQLQQLALKTRDASDKKISIKRKITRKLSRKDENR